MIIVSTIDELKSVREVLQKSVGFVPTMGALHAGHLSLIRKSIDENSHTIVSIFVNPTQFLASEDLSAYPRRQEADLDICKRAGVDVVFVPNIDDIYEDIEPLIKAPPSKGYTLEGEFRPTHFDGVLRVVLKLLNLTRPKNAYFGKKDAQQLYLVQNMAKTLFLNTNIIPCEIVREHDGLALSSRNVYLSQEERQEALKISLCLREATKLIMQKKLTCKAIKEKMQEILKPLKAQYIEIVSRDFEMIEEVEIGNSIILVACFVGKTRLIDNVWV